MSTFTRVFFFFFFFLCLKNQRSGNLRLGSSVTVSRAVHTQQVHLEEGWEQETPQSARSHPGQRMHQRLCGMVSTDPAWEPPAGHQPLRGDTRPHSGHSPRESSHQPGKQGLQQRQSKAEANLSTNDATPTAPDSYSLIFSLFLLKKKNKNNTTQTSLLIITFALKKRQTFCS